MSKQEFKRYRTLLKTDRQEAVAELAQAIFDSHDYDYNRGFWNDINSGRLEWTMLHALDDWELVDEMAAIAGWDFDEDDES